MERDTLVQHWMAEGFLEPSKECDMVMEDIGNMYFNILLATSFFENARKDDCGNIISCKMHDLVHKFALSISKSEILILEGDSMDNVSEVQPLFVRYDGEITQRISFSGNSFMKTRTLILENLENLNFVDILSNFKCLRVLRLSGLDITRLPNSIEQLIHLRLLHILDTEIMELPKSITKLYNLQTLRIEECPYLMGLPEDLSNLINLRHICIIDSNVGSEATLKNVARLTCLQTLPEFFVGQDEGYRLKELGPLKNLRGKINIYGLEKVEDEEEAKSAKLKDKKIFKLVLYWDIFGGELDNNDKVEKVLEGLHPHPNLKSLTIEGYGGKKFPSWVKDLSLFHNLIRIKLIWCTKCEEVPTLGHLPRLRVLEIFSMCKVRSIGREFYSYSDGSFENTNKLFPALRILKLMEMETLVEWKDAKELTSASEVLVFPSLEKLTLHKCPDLSYLPNSLHNCVSLRNFVVEGCPKLRSLPGVPSVIQHLEIKRCGIDELPHGLQFCASLQYLGIEKCPNLKLIPESLDNCVSLQKFVIQDCSRLSSLPGVPSVIQHLEIIGCGIYKLPSGLQFCTSLQHLEITRCSNLKSIPESLHTCDSLQKFAIQDCPHLSCLRGVPSVIQHLEIRGCGIDELPSGLHLYTSLQYLGIENCPNLKSIPDLGELFHSLIKLKISNCRLKLLREGRLQTLVIGGLDAFPILRYPSIRSSYASLKKLILWGTPTLNSLPEEIRHFTALEELCIEEFDEMEALPDWLGIPSSLQKLSLYFCKKLMCLPILGLTNLKHLHIAYCPSLEERCADGSSEEWFKIAHIPNIKINGKYVQGAEDFEGFDGFEDNYVFKNRR